METVRGLSNTTRGVIGVIIAFISLISNIIIYHKQKTQEKEIKELNQKINSPNINGSKFINNRFERNGVGVQIGAENSNS